MYAYMYICIYVDIRYAKDAINHLFLNIKEKVRLPLRNCIFILKLSNISACSNKIYFAPRNH